MHARFFVPGTHAEGDELDLPDDEAHAALLRIKGVGPWTANIYLLMALRRADIWPDGLSITGHKLGGPLGVGALLLAKGVDPVPILHGGGQERDVRSGTLDTPAIAGFAYHFHSGEALDQRAESGTDQIVVVRK